MMENQELAIEDLTASLLAKHRPDLVKKMYTEESLESNAPELLASMREGAKGEGFKAGVDAERQRCRAIVQEALALSATVKNGTEILKMSEKLLADGVEAKLVKTGEATTGSGEAIADLKLKAAQLLSTQGPPLSGSERLPGTEGRCRR
jgi:hypothetical protein